MSAAGEPWIQISLHAVKSDPHHKSTPRPPVQYPQLEYRRLACHFILTQERRTIPQRPPLTAIKSADNDFLLLRPWWGGQPQHWEMHLFCELIDAGSQFVIERRENDCLLNLELCRFKHSLGAWLWQSGGGQHVSFKTSEEEEAERFLFALFIFGINCFYTVTINLKSLF